MMMVIGSLQQAALRQTPSGIINYDNAQTGSDKSPDTSNKWHMLHHRELSSPDLVHIYDHSFPLRSKAPKGMKRGGSNAAMK